MPSLEQLRYEKLADAVERANRTPLLAMIFGGKTEPVEVRVERLDGTIVEFKLKQVVLDGGELVGQITKRKAIVVPLAEVKAISWRRLSARRTAIACGATIAASIVVSAVSVTSPYADAVGFGVTFGVILSPLVAVLLNQFKLLSPWSRLYDRDR